MRRVQQPVRLGDSHQLVAGRGAWPFNEPFYLILNLAVGGTWGGVEGVDDAAMPQRMAVDYVRVW